jgi:hypothetical protein
LLFKIPFQRIQKLVFTLKTHSHIKCGAFFVEKWRNWQSCNFFVRHLAASKKLVSIIWLRTFTIPILINLNLNEFIDPLSLSTGRVQNFNQDQRRLVWKLSLYPSVHVVWIIQTFKFVLDSRVSDKIKKNPTLGSSWYHDEQIILHKLSKTIYQQLL